MIFFFCWSRILWSWSAYSFVISSESWFPQILSPVMLRGTIDLEHIYPQPVCGPLLMSTASKVVCKLFPPSSLINMKSLKVGSEQIIKCYCMGKSECDQPVEMKSYFCTDPFGRHCIFFTDLGFVLLQTTNNDHLFNPWKKWIIFGGN